MRWKKKLISIQVYGSSSHVTPENRDVLGAAVIEVHFLFYILMETDAHVGGCRRNQGKSLPAISARA